jgi:hypothetical protein
MLGQRVSRHRRSPNEQKRDQATLRGATQVDGCRARIDDLKRPEHLELHPDPFRQAEE